MNGLQKILLKLAGQKSLTIPALNNGPQGRLIQTGGVITWMPDNYNSYIVNGYQANDIIYAIINMIMEKIKVAPWGLYQVIDEPSLRKYNAFLKAENYVEAKRIRHKAIEPLTNLNAQTGRLAELLKWPNEEDTFNELVAADAGFINITGNNYMWADLLNGGANAGLPGELWNLPAQYVGIKATGGFPARKTGYILNSPYSINYSTEQILHEKLFNPAAGTNGQSLYGMSPIKAALKTLTRNNAAKKAGAVQLDNNGAAGIAYIDEDTNGPNLDERAAQARDIKEVMSGSEYSGAGNYGKVAYSGFKMGYTQIGSSLKDMALTDIEMVDLRILANVWGIPAQLLNDPENKSFNNAKEAEKALTVRGAIPRLTSTRNNFNRKIQTDWGLKGKNVYVDFDLSVYTELQEDQAAKWAWVNTLPVSPKYKLEMMGLDVPNDPDIDVILLNGQYMTLADAVGGLNDRQVETVNDELAKAGIADYLRIAK